MTRRARAIRLGLAAVVALSVVAALPSTAQDDADDHCREHTVGGATAACETTGRQLEVGAGTFEPTMGADPDGNLYYARADRNGVAIGFGAGVMRSADQGETWADVTPRLAGQDLPPETNDPMIYVDPSTGRVFQFHMSPVLTCSVMSFSDDAGETWTTNPVGCGPTGVWDHQSMVAAAPRVVQTLGYPNVLHQCVNAVYAAMCSRSLDGGTTWSPSTPAYLNESRSGTLYGAQHGHLAAGPDGTVYLPSPMMATVPTVWVSRDDGLTWQRSVIAPTSIPFTDPAVAVDGAGNVYATFVDHDGWLHYAVSTDQARTWSDAVPIAPGVTATLPAIAAGDPGRVVIAYPGTDDLPAGFGTPKGDVDPAAVAWGGYLSVSTDALSASPTFTTVRATGDDPLMRGRAACASGGRCAYQVDFIDVLVDPAGRVFASLADGCTGACATTPTEKNNERHGRGVVITLPDVSLCASTCADYADPPDVAPGAAPALSPLSHPQPERHLQALAEAYRVEADRQRRLWASGGAVSAGAVSAGAAR